MGTQTIENWVVSTKNIYFLKEPNTSCVLFVESSSCGCFLLEWRYYMFFFYKFGFYFFLISTKYFLFTKLYF